MVATHRRVPVVRIVLLVLLTVTVVGSAGAQGLSPSPGLQSSSPPLLTPSNPLGAPGSSFSGPASSDVVPLSSGLFGQYLPRIPNLEFGFVYAIGPNLRAGRAIADYTLPISLNSNSVLFGEAHAELQDFWKSRRVASTTGPGFITSSAPATNRTDLSFGGGYRTIVGGNTLVGVNAFFDTSRIFEKWYSSGGAGLEMVANLTDNDAVDLRANWYGNLFNREIFINAFRNKGQSYDITAGFNHGIFDQAADLRLSFTGYEFGSGSAIYGYKTGADLTTRDGVFRLAYEHGRDPVNGSYDTIGGFVNVGFQVENLLRGESPITLPTPVFNSPRSLTYWLTRQVKRNWHQPTAVVLSRTGAFGSTTGAGGPGCDRTLASVSMSPLGGGNYDSAVESFPNFPYTSLVPTKFIVVELDYTFDAIPPATVDWLIAVASLPVLRQNQFGQSPVVMPFPPSESGHLSFTLNTSGIPFVGQSSFTLAPGQDPNRIQILVRGATGTSDVQITNVCIRFNQ